VFLGPCSRCFRGFIGRIRAFRLPIHLKAKAAAVRLFAPRDPLRDEVLVEGEGRDRRKGRSRFSW
jgi:hypothetical protein